MIVSGHFHIFKILNDCGLVELHDVITDSILSNHASGQHATQLALSSLLSLLVVHHFIISRTLSKVRDARDRLKAFTFCLSASISDLLYIPRHGTYQIRVSKLLTFKQLSQFLSFYFSYLVIVSRSDRCASFARLAYLQSVVSCSKFIDIVRDKTQSQFIIACSGCTI